MATIDYVEIPSAATRLKYNKPNRDIRPAPKIVTSLPNHEGTSNGLDSAPPPFSPTKGGLNIQQILFSSALQLPANAPTRPRTQKGAERLLTARDPLSIPITTANFKRFVSKAGPIFWCQDRIEEIIMWRKGWQYTAVWMSAYALLCYFPHLILSLPLVIVLGVLLATDRSLPQPPSKAPLSASVAEVQSPSLSQPGEDSVDWLANLQAIQNLMGTYSDGHDMVLPVVCHLIHKSPYSPIVLTLALTSLLVLIPMANFLSLRFTFLILGLVPFFFTHPWTRHTLLPAFMTSLQPYKKRLRMHLVRYIDNDRLEDKHWNTEIREVELWENERYCPGSATACEGEQTDAGWSKANLKPGERTGWTRGRDGWSGVADDGCGDVSSNLTFSLSPGWLFVETEDWRPDLEGSWVPSVGADRCGWIYTNDVWMEPHVASPEAWRSANSMTRRRRWVRRIYYDPNAGA